MLQTVCPHCFNKMDLFIHFIFSLMMVVTMTRSEPLLVSTLTGEQEDTCSIYPVCSDYGQGKHQILEDCRRYFECERQAYGTFTQRNWMCEDNLLFTDKLGRCETPTWRRSAKSLRTSNANLSVREFISHPRDYPPPRSQSPSDAFD